MYSNNGPLQSSEMTTKRGEDLGQFGVYLFLNYIIHISTYGYGSIDAELNDKKEKHGVPRKGTTDHDCRRKSEILPWFAGSRELCRGHRK